MKYGLISQNVVFFLVLVTYIINNGRRNATNSWSIRIWHATQQPLPYLVPSSKFKVHSRSTRGEKGLGTMANTPFYLVSLLLLLGAISAFHQQVLIKLTTLYMFHMTPISLLLLSLFVTVTTLNSGRCYTLFDSVSLF